MTAAFAGSGSYFVFSLLCRLIFFTFCSVCALSALVGSAAGDTLTWDGPDGGDWNTSSYWNPGHDKTPTLTDEAYINNNAVTITGTAYGSYIDIGHDTGSIGTLTINGQGASLTNSGPLDIGYMGTGYLYITNYGRVSTNETFIGSESGNAATSIVTVGSGGSLTTSGYFCIGNKGNGFLDITAGGIVTTNGATVLGNNPGFTGTVSVGPAGKWNLADLAVGYNGIGYLTITGGGEVISTGATGIGIGYFSGSTGTVEVDGPGSTLTNHNLLAVGYSGTGILNVKNGGAVFSGALSVGIEGTGEMNITAGGLVENANGYIGGMSPSSSTTGIGTVTVSGEGSAWTNSNDLHIGYLGEGELTIADNGTVNVGSGTGIVSLGEGATGTGILNIGGSTAQAQAAGVLNAGSVAAGTGSATLRFNHTGTAAGKYYFRNSQGNGINLTGTLDLIHSNGYTVLTGTDSRIGGSTIISGGTLQIGDGGTTGSIVGDILNNSALVFNRSDDLTYAGVISGAGSLTKDGAGKLTLSNANTYAGMTTVKDGTLALDSGASLASTGLAMYGGATFDNTNGGTHSLAGGSLDVYGPATYKGNLDARNAALNFYVPTDMGNEGTMLAVAGTAYVADSTVNVGINGGSSPLQIGDSIALIDADNPIDGAPANNTANGRGMLGVSLRYKFDILTDKKDDTRLLAVLTDIEIDPRTRALSEGFLSRTAMLIQGADALADRGISDAVRAAKAGAAREGFGLAGFGTVSGGRIRYNTGSHVDISGFSLLAGLSLGCDLSLGRLSLGAFFEYGRGDYDTYNSFSDAASVHGGGDTGYMGGGVLGHFEFTDTGPGHVYVEASARTGRAENDFSSSDLLDFTDRKAAYDSASPYYGVHFGTGYVWNITDNASLDLYGKYFWTRQEGDTVKLSTGDPVHFAAVDSHRVRGGGRFTYAVNESFSPYIGAAYEHEFDGEARATTNGYRIGAPTLEGSTGIGEAGLSFRTTTDVPLSIDLGVQGHTGQREGVTGSLHLKLEF